MASPPRKPPELPVPHMSTRPVTDPAAALPPTARPILAAARRVLVRDGFSGLTFEAISAESGENKSGIRYYFGSKGGFITALIDWIDHDDTAKLIKELSTDYPGIDRAGDTADLHP